MTGFRVALGGAQAHYGVMPDLTTLGKVIGGGLPVGAYGGRRAIMELVAPAGSMYQAGTLSGNPLAMAAGLATLRVLAEPGTFERVVAVADAVRGCIAACAAEVGIGKRRPGRCSSTIVRSPTMRTWPAGRYGPPRAAGARRLPRRPFEAAFASWRTRRGAGPHPHGD